MYGNLYAKYFTYLTSYNPLNGLILEETSHFTDENIEVKELVQWHVLLNSLITDFQNGHCILQGWDPLYQNAFSIMTVCGSHGLPHIKKMLYDFKKLCHGTVIKK